MKKLQIQTHSEEDTIQLGEQLATYLQAGDVITLEGDLAAGKTTFTKGIAHGLDVTRIVNSPTFTMIKEYTGKIPLYHMDVYRLEDSDEDIGFTDYFDAAGVSVIEWAHFIDDYLPNGFLNIHMTYEDENRRLIEWEPHGERYASIAADLAD